MNNDQEYTIERLTGGHLGDIANLHAAVYDRPAARNFFVKKYDTAYTGKQYIGFIAYSRERIAVGFYGVIPCFLQYENAIILSAQSADTMTHPQYRFKGLFVELSNLTFQLCRSEGIRLIFGFPNQNSLHGAIHKLGWTMTETMDCFKIPVKTFPLERIVHKFSFLKPLYEWHIKKVLVKYLEPLQGITNSVIEDGYNGIYRDQKYLSYKTYHPKIVIRINRSLVWIKINPGFIIGDITLHDDFDVVLNGIRKIASKLGIAELQFQSSPQTKLHTLFAERYQPVPSFSVLFQDMDSGLSLDKIKFTFADIDIF
jgi:hypothetical protein